MPLALLWVGSFFCGFEVFGGLKHVAFRRIGRLRAGLGHQGGQAGLRRISVSQANLWGPALKPVFGSVVLK